MAARAAARISLLRRKGTAGLFAAQKIVLGDGHRRSQTKILHDRIDPEPPGDERIEIDDRLCM